MRKGEVIEEEDELDGEKRLVLKYVREKINETLEELGEGN